MDSRVGETPLEQLLEQTITHCRKLPVAKKENLELEELCAALNRRLSNRSLTPEQSNYNNLKSKLVEVEGQLAIWSNYNFPEALLKRNAIKAGIRAFVENLRLGSIASGSPVTPSTPRVNTPDSSGVEGTLPLRGVGNPSPMTTTSPSSHESLPHQAAELEAPEDRPAEVTQPPQVKRLDGEVTRQGDIAFAEGRYCEVWMGLWQKGGKEGAETQKVALKVLKTSKSQGGGERAEKTEGVEGVERAERARKGIEDELLRWTEADLHHPNILPFYGVVTNIETRLYMVFPWRENGNLLVYVKKHPKADKNRLLRGSAAGLNYLHSMGFVHGNVRCNNVFVTHKGEPQICDFGMAKVFHETHETRDNTVSKTMSPAANVRYAAPELIEHNDFPITKHSDTYSFALLILECITEAPPFSEINRDAKVIHERLSKKRCPLRPNGEHRIPDNLWDLMNRCWSIVPDQRPPMERVHSFFLRTDAI